MAAVGAAYISRQPRSFDVHNSFGLMGNENLLRTWIFRDEGCGCAGSYYTNLTDTRLLLRAEDSTCCSCSCCGEHGHADASIFLRDIAEIRESKESQGCCTRFCAKCCGCCGCCESSGCCCHSPKHLEVRGVFGSEIIHVSKEDVPKVQIEIPAAIGNHKLVSQY
jgi:hypothetical protein